MMVYKLLSLSFFKENMLVNLYEYDVTLDYDA